MSRRRVNNPLALAVLCCLFERPMHPYEISTTLRTRGKEQSVRLNYGSLYSVVESLQKHGLIQQRETSREGRRPERTVYEITAAGQAECEDWLAELLSTPVHNFTSLEAGLSMMMVLSPDEVARLLEERGTRLLADLRALDASLSVTNDLGLPAIFVIESQFRRAMLVAEFEFVQTLASEIRKDELGGTSAWRRMHELLAEGITFEQIGADPVRYLGEEGRALQPDRD